MKQKVLSRVLLLIALTLCTQSYAKGGKGFAFLFESQSGWVQEDSVVKVTYNIKGGDGTDGNGRHDNCYPYVIVAVKNKTMKPIYIDLGQCFLVKGEDPYAYYEPGETHTTTGTSTGASVNTGSIAGALGVGGIAGTLANGVNVGGGRSSATTNITFTQRIVTVPPMATKVLPQKPLISYFRDQSGHIRVKDFGGTIEVGNKGTKTYPYLYLFMDKSKSQPEYTTENFQYREYTTENTPVSLHSFIVYSLTEDCGQTTMFTHNCSVRYVVETKYRKNIPSVEGINTKYTEELNSLIPNMEQYRDFFVKNGM